MATECCGKKISSAYCPSCGKAQVEDHLQSLLNYVRGHAAGMVEQYASLKKTMGGRNEQYLDDRAIKSLHKMKRSADKWADMLVALNELIEFRNKHSEHQNRVPRKQAADAVQRKSKPARARSTKRRTSKPR